MDTARSNAGFFRLWDIVGDETKGIDPIIPVSKATWWNGVRAGRFPKPVKLGPRTTAWPKKKIYELADRFERGEA